MNLGSEDLKILVGALNKTLEALEDWEFHIRLGFERHEVERVLSQLKEFIK
jgi:hypothetical protein